MVRHDSDDEALRYADKVDVFNLVITMGDYIDSGLFSE